jgi:Ca-activated chloride channel family protein
MRKIEDVCMNRSQITFALIILGALIFVGAATLINTLNKRASDNKSAITSVTENETPSAVLPGTVEIVVLSANTKERWMNAMADQFNALNQTLSNGQHALVRVISAGSEMDETVQPVAWSPANQGWVDQVNQDWQDRYNRNLITGTCPSTANIPLGIAMWRPMAEALGWPDNPISWNYMAALATNPDGWAALGHPEWGDFRFGHGHPVHSNSGRLSIVAEIYAATGQTTPLTVDDVWSDVAVNDVADVETSVYHYGRIDTDLLNRMVQRGPTYLHAVTNYESNVIRWNQEYADELRFPLVLIYPSDGTFWMNHPFCLLNNAPWVTPVQLEGAQQFGDFITQTDQQAQLVQFGIRPASTNVPLSDPFTLDKGVISTNTPDNIPLLPYPDQDVMNNVIDMWKQEKKPSSVLLIIDTSASMNGDPLIAAVAGAQAFIQQMQPQDEISVLTFNDTTIQLGPSGRVSDVGEQLQTMIGGLIASGNTALFDVTVQGIEQMDNIRTEDIDIEESRIYGIVLMTDGQNTTGTLTQAQMQNALPSGEEVGNVRIYTIAYGEQTDVNLLTMIANRTNGQMFESTPENISQIYFLISSEF